MRHAFREAVAAFRRAPVLTGLSAAMVGLALLVVGLFSLAAYNLQVALAQAEERVAIVAYLQEQAPITELTATEDEILAMPEVEDLFLVTKTEALEAAKRDLPEFAQVFEDLESNPLPPSLEIEIADGYRNHEAVARVAEIVEAFPIVEDVSYGQDWVEQLFTLRRLAGVTAAVFGTAFALVAALIIGTALRIAIFARKEEIYIMRLVGARNGFIRSPFLLEGGMTGLFGGMMALGFTYLVYSIVYRNLFTLDWIPWTWALIGIASGAAFGVFASAVSVRRHLREV